jgi:tetratricopeptide (TPR) repeat protein
MDEHKPVDDAQNQQPGKDEARNQQPSKDIAPLLRGWEYESGTINVRKIRGVDGRPKLQMRLDLGLLQMELTGRPDGRRPHGHESLLDYFEEQLEDHRRQHGTELGYHLTATQCQSLREEAVMYYHRYLSLFILEDFAGVVRDTARNLRLLDFCGQYAVEEEDRLVMEQYRPYITMMNARAAASVQFKQKRYQQAIKTVDEGIERIREFYERFGHEEAFERSGEVKVLRRFARDIRRKLPVDPIRKLQGQLNRAVKDERYEDAAKLRDEIEKRKVQSKSMG